MIFETMQQPEANRSAPSDFSIDHILNRAGSSNLRQENYEEYSGNLDYYSWMQCTRYCPPKIPRFQRKVGSSKRQLGRHPRIPFTSQQLAVLEQTFRETPYLSSEDVINLSQKLKLADLRVKIWFQNRRARERREKNLNKESTNIQSPTTSYQNQEEILQNAQFNQKQK